MKKIIKKIVKALLPQSLRVFKSRVRTVQKANNASLPLALLKSRFYCVDRHLTEESSYVRQMAQMMKRLEINLSLPYVYPYDTWKQRVIPDNCMPLFSITVDYSTILASSLSDLRKRVNKSCDSQFKENELNMIEAIDKLATRIGKRLEYVHSERGECLRKYFAHMLNYRPNSFDEALQKILFYNGLFWQARHWHNGLGRLDLILEKYYNTDIKAGVLTRETAKEMLRDFVQILGLHTISKSVVLIGDTGQYILLGGVSQDGKTIHNDLTELFLEIFTELKVPDPKLILRVNEHTSDVIWRKAIDCIITGCGSPLLMNEKLIIDGMVEFGYKKEDVWNVGTSACWEPLIIGKSFDQNNPLPNIPVVQALNDTIEKGIEYTNITELIKDVKSNISKQIADTVHDISFDVSPLYSLFFDSCIEREKDYTLGGADYAYHGVQIVGLPNLVNALLNVKTYVFEQKIISFKNCKIALAENFVGHEDLRQLLKANELKYGSSDAQVIKLTNDLMTFVSHEVEKYTCNGEKLKVGFSSSQYISARMRAKASLDGRKDYEPFAVHISPVNQKIDIQEVMDFAGALNYSGNRMNGNVVDFILPSSYIKQKEKLVAILRNAMTNGVYELQLNVLDAATLRDAKAHPEKYPTLVVRVWGFSTYFNDLPEEYKDNLIARAEAYE